jgi:hypothetical protein
MLVGTTIACAAIENESDALLPLWLTEQEAEALLMLCAS